MPPAPPPVRHCHRIRAAPVAFFAASLCRNATGRDALMTQRRGSRRSCSAPTASFPLPLCRTGLSFGHDRQPDVATKTPDFRQAGREEMSAHRSVQTRKAPYRSTLPPFVFSSAARPRSTSCLAGHVELRSITDRLELSLPATCTTLWLVTTVRSARGVSRGNERDTSRTPHHLFILCRERDVDVLEHAPKRRSSPTAQLSNRWLRARLLCHPTSSRELQDRVLELTCLARNW